MFAALTSLGLDPAKAQITRDAPAWYHPGRSATLRLGPKVVLAHFGDVHPATLKALDVDPAHLLRLAMCEYLPDTWDAIEEIMQSTVLTANELKLVHAYREVTGDNDAEAVVINRDAVIALVAT